MPSTTFQNLPYPAPTDPVDVPGDIQALAEAIDTKMLDKAVLNAKGDLLCGLADNTVTAVTVGADKTVLVADSTAVPGLKWDFVGVPTGVVNPFAGINAPDGWLLCDGSAVSRTTYAALFATFATTFTTATTTNASATVSGLSGMTSSMIGWGIAGTNIPTGATITAVGSATSVTISANATGTASGTANIAISPYGFTGAGNTTTFNLPNMKGRVPAGRDTGQTEFDVLGETGGAKTHTLTTAEMPVHTHTQNSHSHGTGSHGHSASTGTAYAVGGITVAGGAGTSKTADHVTGFSASATSSIANGGTDIPAGNHAHSVSVSSSGSIISDATAVNQNAGSGGAHNNLQPYIVLNYIIKT